jgi:hypothetical protein
MRSVSLMKAVRGRETDAHVLEGCVQVRVALGASKDDAGGRMRRISSSGTERGAGRSGAHGGRRSEEGGGDGGRGGRRYRPDTKMRTLTLGSVMLKMTPGNTSGSYLPRVLAARSAGHAAHAGQCWEAHSAPMPWNSLWKGWRRMEKLTPQ